jgi:hypothetical protein
LTVHHGRLLATQSKRHCSVTVPACHLVTTPEPYYIIDDQLGSSAVVTDHNGALVASEKFFATGINETLEG